LWGRTWADGLESRTDGLWPAFDNETLVRTIRLAAGRSYWDEWKQVRCPTLIVRAEGGTNAADYRLMLELNPRSQLVDVPNAGHDLHLDKPDFWRMAVQDFLRESSAEKA
jgi:pimeloyl-ACP methyl ester carboxylesterase